ncbi:hypothetical protein [Pseudosulfitobacter koreensis]|uniref:Uncharacterized protein n=1 Tax=Pseudosulfitobacter koreensis TaxID=2968472 RepID=A0ABT1YX95_9RHOB|nr:hypothetical protein [Pseudosulfitobacter koreense]MCR8825496.1 hypothetical protein [Pseudosulfitobacter koreense]
MSLDMLIFGLLALILVAVVIFATTGRRSGQQHSSEFDPTEKFAQLRDKGRSNFR